MSLFQMSRSKRQKRSGSVSTNTDFCLSIVSPGPLKQMVSTLSNLLTDGTFIVTEKGLFIKGLDDNSICLITAELVVSSVTIDYVNPDYNPDETDPDYDAFDKFPKFAITMSTLHNCLSTIGSNACLKIYREKGHAELCIEAETGREHVSFFKLSTIETSNLKGMKPMEFNYQIEMEVSSFDNAVKSAGKFGCELITCQLAKPKNANHPTFFFMKGHSVSVPEFEHEFYSYAALDQNNKTVKIETERIIKNDFKETDSNEDQSPPVIFYEGSFKVDYLTNFCKGVETKMVTLHFSSEMTPLQFSYPLDSSGSYIRYILAAREEG